MDFTYTAKNKEGKTVSGKTVATDKQSVVASLTKQGLEPIIVKVQGEAGKTKKGGLLSFGGKKVELKELVVFTRQLSTMISAGVPLTRALSTLQSQAEGKYFKQVISAIAKDIEGGIPLADSFEKFPSVFSDVYVNMVRAGEAGGILDEILKRLASQVEQDSSMRKKVKSAMTYPMVILGITVMAFFGIMLFVMPQLGKIMFDLGGPDAQLPVYTRAMLGISDFMKGNAVIMFIVIFIGVFLFKKAVSTPKGKYIFHSVLLRLPVIKTIITKVAIARFSRTFASLMSAGVGVLESLNITGGAIGNKVIEAELKEAAKAVKNGKQLSEPLSQSKHFPAIVSQMLAVGEETGQVDKILVKVADFYEEEVETTIDSLSSIIEPIMIVVLGGLVGLIAASVMGPIANLSKNIGGT